MQIAVQHDMMLHQMDVKSAYLHAPIDQEVYVTQPTGYAIANKVWKLNKSLYGLKQSGRNWHQTLNTYFKELGFNQSTADLCIFFKRDGNEIIILLVWVDDIILAHKSMSDIKSKLELKFDMKDLGKLSSFLGITFNQVNGTVTMSQEHYLNNVLKSFGKENCKPRSTPCESNLKLYKESNAEEKDITEYRRMVGTIILCIQVIINFFTAIMNILKGETS